MVPKRALNVMTCEIVRLLQLTQSAVVPISYHVQRKVILLFITVAFSVMIPCILQQSHSDFHADLFPDTLGGSAAMTAEQWLQGANCQVAMIAIYLAV